LASSNIISDGLTVLRNAQIAGKEEVTIPGAKILYEIMRIFKDKGLIKDFAPKKEKKKNLLSVKLKYDAKGNPVITQLKQISSSSRRVYAGNKSIPRIANGYATVILSTSKGVMTGKEASEKKCGGEVLCYVM